MRTFLIVYKYKLKEYMDFVTARSSSIAIRKIQAKFNEPIKVLSVEMTRI